MALTVEFLQMLIISAFVGGLIGIERELKVEVIAGVRTFMLISMFATLSVFISEQLDMAPLISIAFIGMISITILMGIIKNFKLGDVGITTLISLLLAFLLGLLIGKGLFLEGIAGSIIVTGILVSKGYSQRFSEALTHEEIISALQFGFIAFVLYPIVPNRTIDPLGVINPRTLIFITIVATSIGFAGFLAMRKVGFERGLPIVGALGGLLNSEATASALSARVKKNADMISSAFQGIILANTVMLLRNLAIAGAISLAVLRGMLIPQLAMVAIGIIYFYPLRSKVKPKKEEIKVKSPFAILPATLFATIFVLISWIVDLLKDFGWGGVYLPALLGGLFSSAAVTASFASLYSVGRMDLNTVALACVISAIGSTFSKIFISSLFGTNELSKKVIIPMILMIISGVIVLVVL